MIALNSTSDIYRTQSLWDLLIIRSNPTPQVCPSLLEQPFIGIILIIHIIQGFAWLPWTNSSPVLLCCTENVVLSLRGIKYLTCAKYKL